MALIIHTYENVYTHYAQECLYLGSTMHGGHLESLSWQKSLLHNIASHLLWPKGYPLHIYLVTLGKWWKDTNG